jgi:putative endonuclease
MLTKTGFTRFDTTAVGADGEKRGNIFLVRQGYTIVTTNYRTLFGEIDVIARHEGDLVFIEIKYRRSDEYGWPAEAVTRRKQGRMVRSALVYLKQHKLSNVSVRFDVLAIGPGPGCYDLIPSAFSVPPMFTV